jgi:type I restriction enzyme S subunit
VHPNLDGAAVSGDFPLFDINPERLEQKFLEWKSKTGEFVDLCRSVSEGTTNRVRLKEDRFLRLEFSLPPLPEQRRIVARIEALAAKIEEARTAKRDIEKKARGMINSVHLQISLGMHRSKRLAIWLPSFAVRRKSLRIRNIQSLASVPSVKAHSINQLLII